MWHLSWLSLLFAILALACRAQENPERGFLFDKLSIKYEKAAWDCLSINNPPFEPSATALKAVILIIYGRVHRGEDVSKNLQSAYNMANSISCHQCYTQSMACDEHQIILIGLKMLLAMNSQRYGYYHNQEISRCTRLLDGINGVKPVGIHSLSIGAKACSPLEMTFTVLKFRLLEISDTIGMSTQHGFLPECSLPGVINELSRMEKHCNELYAGLSAPESQKGFCKGRLGILQYNIQYLLKSIHSPYLKRYLDGDITPHT